MRIQSTPEMKNLREIWKPYRSPKGGGLIADAPKKAKEAYKKWCELFDKEYYGPETTIIK